MKAYPEYYYDAKGRELDWETGKPMRPNTKLRHEG
jgi:hypothetical protein